MSKKRKAKVGSGWKTFYEKSLEKAKDLDASGLSDLGTKALDKLSDQQEKIEGFGKDIKDLAGLVTAFAKGKYTKIPWKIVVACAAALLYFLNPLDLIPDVIFGVGFLDDLTVAAFVVRSFSEEIGQFRNWRDNQSTSEAE